MKEAVISIVIGVLETVPKGLERELEELEIGRCAETIQTKISQNTKKSPGYLRRLDITFPHLNDNKLTLGYVGIHGSSKSISPRVDVIAPLKYEFAYYDVIFSTLTTTALYFCLVKKAHGPTKKGII